MAPTLAEIRTALAARPAEPIAGERLMRSAAVAAVFRDAGRGPELLLIPRAERSDDPWSGDMAFPGGVVSASDPGPFEAALRETSEELGLDLGRHARRIGELTHVLAVAHRRPLPMAIVPFVFDLAGAPALRAGPEVQESLWVPLAYLADPHRRQRFVRPLLGVPLRLECCRYRERIVWGLTLRMIDDLLAALGARQRG
jgi:8-oxo-dGTP pyrophosphatase MutT (NUDIX family)